MTEVTSASKIEQELLAATKIKPKKNERRQPFLKRLVAAVFKLDEETWESLSPDATDWYNTAAEANSNEDDLPDFPDIDLEVEKEEPPKDEEVDEETGEVIEKKPGIQKARPGRKSSACHLIKMMVVKHPSISIDQLVAKVEEKDLKVSKVTVATIRSDTRDTLRVLNEAGITSFTL